MTTNPDLDQARESAGHVVELREESGPVTVRKHYPGLTP